MTTENGNIRRYKLKKDSKKIETGKSSKQYKKLRYNYVNTLEKTFFFIFINKINKIDLYFVLYLKFTYNKDILLKIDGKNNFCSSCSGFDLSNMILYIAQDIINFDYSSKKYSEKEGFFIKRFEEKKKKYCLKCKTDTENINYRVSKTSEERIVFLFKCVVFNIKKSRFSKE